MASRSNARGCCTSATCRNAERRRRASRRRSAVAGWPSPRRQRTRGPGRSRVEIGCDECRRGYALRTSEGIDRGASRQSCESSKRPFRSAIAFRNHMRLRNEREAARPKNDTSRIREEHFFYADIRASFPLLESSYLVDKSCRNRHRACCFHFRSCCRALTDGHHSRGCDARACDQLVRSG